MNSCFFLKIILLIMNPLLYSESKMLHSFLPRINADMVSAMIRGIDIYYTNAIF